MRSWVFRQRARLRVIYGLPPAEPPAPRTRAADARREDEGTLQRRSRWVILRPMRRAG